MKKQQPKYLNFCDLRQSKAENAQEAESKGCLKNIQDQNDKVIFLIDDISQ